VSAQTILEPVRTSITVVEKLVAETPALVTAVGPEEIGKVPGVNLDDRLRMVPGFSLFRRSSSVVAHPTTQGVSLRGIGPTGASRTLVRWDGVPVNDPFGGWVQWTRFSPEDLERVEVSRGASTSVFGDRAMGGAISLFSEEVARSHLRGGYEVGNRDSHLASAGFAHLRRRFAVSGNGRAFTTDGYFVVPEEVRGAVDRKANVRFVTGDTRLDLLGTNQRLFLKFDVLAEERANGTAAQTNSTTLGNLAGHYFRESDRNGITVLAYHTRGEFRSFFSAIAASRNTETVTTIQSVPAEATGGAGMWRHSGAGWHSLVGADFHRVEGFSNETVPATGVRRTAGGSQFQHGYFAQADAAMGPARLFLGTRYHFAGGGEHFLSPSAGLAGAVGRLRMRGSVYRSFRAPTLNELHREFRVGNVVTRANERLAPESLFGAEVGIDLAGESSRVSVTAYRNSLDDLITNVTLSVAPNLIVRQRQNADQALTRGLEVEARRRWGRLTGEAAYLFSGSRFRAAARVPQVPKHQGSAQLSYAAAGILVSLGLRAYAFQFEDDANLFVLPGFAYLHFAVRQRLARQLFAVGGVENLLDRRYLVGFTPTPQIGAPLLWRAGLRWEGGR
jgi:outer membrane cobalamin receptor